MHLPHPRRLSKNARVRRVQREREAKLVENVKKCLMLHGTKSSDIVNSALRDLVRTCAGSHACTHSSIERPMMSKFET